MDKLTPSILWLRTLKYVREQLGPDASIQQVNEVASDVYDKMKFLLDRQPSCASEKP